MPGYRAGLLFVATEDLHLLTQVANVEELEQVIPGRGDQPVAIVIPLQIHYGGFVGMSVMHYKFLLKMYLIQEYLVNIINELIPFTSVKAKYFKFAIKKNISLQF